MSNYPISAVINLTITSPTPYALSGSGNDVTATLALQGGNSSNFTIASDNSTLHVLVEDGTPALVSFVLPVTTLAATYTSGGTTQNVTATLSITGLSFALPQPPDIPTANIYVNPLSIPNPVQIDGYSVTVPANSVSFLDENNEADPASYEYSITFSGTTSPDVGTFTFTLDPTMINEN